MNNQQAKLPPPWPPCTEPTCIGVRVEGEDTCLAHVGDEVRTRFLSSLEPGVSLDLRGTPVSSELLLAVLSAVQAPDGRPRLGEVRCSRAQFSGAYFEEARFTGPAQFRGAQFNGNARFQGAHFHERARFDQAEFAGPALFQGVRFNGGAEFTSAQFRMAAEFTSTQSRMMSLFDGVQFSGVTSFSAARLGRVRFERAEFHGTAEFDRAEFWDAEFERAKFKDTATFTRAQFTEDVGWFAQVQFAGDAEFTETRFWGDAVFEGAHFGGTASFEGAQVTGAASFAGADFKQADALGPILAGGRLVLDRAVFENTVLVEAATPELACVGTRFTGAATLRVRWAGITLDDSTFAKPSSIAFAESPFRARAWRAPGRAELFGESLLAAGWGVKPRLLSLRGVDTSTLTVTELDLSACLFAGTHNLDRFRMEGPRPFADTPRGWQFGRVGGQGLPMWRWTRRQALAEEHHWRATRQALPEERWWSNRPLLPAAPSGRLHPKRAGWHPSACQAPRWVTDQTGHSVERLYPLRIASLYRALRKAQEDSKNEPGASDFYFGEMEMRRKARVSTPKSERFILTVYWLISGYGLRGLRALAWLAAVILVVALLFKHAGFNHGDPSFWDSLIYTAQSTVSVESENRALVDHLSQTGEVLRVVVRLAGPVLLGLALLAVRNRVKR